MKIAATFFVIFVLTCVGGFAWIVAHFIAKFW